MTRLESECSMGDKFVSPIEPDVYPPPLDHFIFTDEMLLYLAEHGLVEMWDNGPFTSTYDIERTSDLFVGENERSYHGD